MGCTHGGPIDQYLKMTGKMQDTFHGEVRSGDPAAVSVFAAEIVFNAVLQLTEAVEKLPGATDRRV